MKVMLKNGVWTIMLVAVALVYTSCNDSNFAGSVRKVAPPTADNHLIKTMGMDENIDGGRKKIAIIDSVDFVIQAADNRILDTDITTNKQPIDLFFVLDTTKSMKDFIFEIKNGITSLVESLDQSGVSVHVGLVGFVDSYSAAAQRTFDLTNDIQAFRSFLSTLSTTGNEDFPESSLYASRRAIELFQNSNSGRPDAVKVVLLISDVIGHNGSDEDGGEPVRDCSLNQLQNDIANYSAALQGSSAFKFFYLVPDPNAYNAGEGASLGCDGKPNSLNALSQMQNLMDSILPELPKAERGGPVLDSNGQMAWPLKANTMVDTLAPMLETTSVSEDVKGKCLAASARLFDGSRELYSWQASDLREINDAYEGDNELLFSNAINDNVSLGSQELRLEVERCCVKNTDLNSGSNSCYESYKQIIRYEIVGQKS